MRYHALAADYDGTLAHHGVVAGETVAALRRLQATGRKLILVTGRELDELLGVFPGIGVFDLVVAENGGLLYWPATREVDLLCEPPAAALVATLRSRGIDPLAVGRTIVATVHPHETVVLESIRDLGLELHVIFNKGAVMVLPTGVNKATGLAAALERLGLSPRNVVAVGDAENDHSMLQFVELGAATANAVPMLVEQADRALAGRHGDGVRELAADLVESDLAAHPPRRRAVLLGRAADGAPLEMCAGANLLIAGASGTGKALLAAGVVERLAAHGYQSCVFDAEGTYPAIADAVVLGSTQAAPTPAELAAALEKPAANVVVNLAGLPPAERPQAFARLLEPVVSLRHRAGRPHALVIEEAHLLLSEGAPALAVPGGDVLTGVVCVSAHPQAVAPAVLQAMDVLVATGATALDALRSAAGAAGFAPAWGSLPALREGEALAWRKDDAAPPIAVHVEPSTAEARREQRTRVAETLPEARSFYFRGPEGQLKLRAQSLALFVQIADGVDDATWLFHLRRGDYSEWLLNAMQDRELAASVRQVEKDREADAAASRTRIRAAIEGRYAAAQTP
jgi:hypothetical protein